MKLSKFIIASVLIAKLVSTSLADEKPGCCDGMKKVQPAPTSTTEIARAELESLVKEMNSNIGQRKLEAMAAIITRLVEQANENPLQVQPAPAKVETHQH